MSYFAVATGLSEARACYRCFHGFAPERTETAAVPRPPRVLVALGELRGLIYRSDRGQAGRSRNFVHIFDRPPRLLCDPAGRQLYIHGGSYRVNRLGLEG